MVFNQPYSAIANTVAGIWGYFFNRPSSPTDSDNERLVFFAMELMELVIIANSHFLQHQG